MKKFISFAEYDHYSDKIPASFDGYRIVMLSDLHSIQIGEDNKILLDCVYALDPDSVMLVGDMVNGSTVNMDVSERFINALAKDYPVYFSCGNHEYNAGTNPVTKRKYISFIKSLKKHGVNYLNNRSAYIICGSDKIKVCGLTISRAYYKKFSKKILKVKTIDKLIGKVPKDVFSVLLAHNPEHFESYASWGADMTFSGHIHGGLMVLPLIGGVISPSLKIFPHYDFGKYTINDSTMYLSRGLGWHTLPIRIFNKPEIMIITLHSGNGGKE